ncbi:hypothetical protein [Miniphocaeibacter massiliensis]|uniref:hypothetical protein n=1 Tax=Miniphocaeibacter massiliensis TaxID=2041841 RepID=UPI000C1C21AE|nr:hypothetical protein [Miniphocaeibacter massiliensis]
MKKSMLVISLLLLVTVFASCSKKLSDEDLLKEFIELNYSNYTEDSKEYSNVEFKNLEGTSNLGLYDEKEEETIKKLKDEIPNIYNKYEKYFNKERYEELLTSHVLGSPQYLDTIDSVEIKDLSIEMDEEKDEGKIYNVKFIAECNSNDDVVYDEEVNSRITIKDGEIIEMINYHSPIIVVLGYMGKSGQ